jgi:Zn-dependent protease with chaperone function
MLAHLPGAPLLALLVAMAPALLRWWWGRSLARLADDPLIAERLAAHGTRVSAIAGACAVVLMIAWPASAWWALPLQIVTQSAAGYPLRRTLYSESWSLAACLGFYTRLAIAVFGFWMLLIATPWMVSLSGRYEWFVATALLGVLLAWSWYSSDVLRVMLRARPVPDGPLLERFRALAAKCRTPMPRFECVEMRGGVLANALALASLRGSSVLFTDTLLARLTPDESVAICGHELAHLEYYDRTRLRRLAALNVVLILIAAFLTPLSNAAFARNGGSWATVVFPVAFVLAMAARARHRQRNETASDLRAVELIGDGETLASALTALHVIARVPRRWDQRREQQATHPSLARRLRDIRAAATTAAAPALLASPARFAAMRGTPIVTFEPSRLQWQESAGTTHLLDYSALAELRLNASQTGAVTLVAVEQGGRRWEMPPLAADVSALQAVLDAVDGRLANERRSAPFSPWVTRLVTLTCSSFVLIGAQLAVAFVALLATITAGPAMLNAAGCAALVAAAVVLRDGPVHNSGFIASLVGCVGVVLLALGRARRSEHSRVDLPLTGLIAAAALASVAVISMSGVDPIRLYQGSRDWPAATVMFVALAAACWTHRQRPSFRYASLLSAALGVVTTVVSSTAFLDAVGRDSFLVAAPRPTPVAIESGQLAGFDLPFEIGSLTLSPGGALAVVARSEEDDTRARAASSGLYIARSGVPPAGLDADDIAFMDDRRAVLLTLTDDGAELRDQSFDGVSRAPWRQRVPGVESGSIAYHATTNEWILVGRDAGGRVVRATGVVGAAGFTKSTWSGATSRGSWIDAVVTHGATALVVERHYETSLSARLPMWAVMLGPIVRSRSETRVRRVDGESGSDVGLSLLDNDCGASTSDDRIVCAAFDGTRTHLVAIDAATATLTPVVTLDGRFWSSQDANYGWMAGWWESGPAAIRLATRDVVRPPRTSDFVSLIAATDKVIATVSPTDEGSRVRVYRLPPGKLAARRVE